MKKADANRPGPVVRDRKSGTWVTLNTKTRRESAVEAVRRAQTKAQKGRRT